MSGGDGAVGVFDGVMERLGELGARIIFAAAIRAVHQPYGAAWVPMPADHLTVEIDGEEER